MSPGPRSGPSNQHVLFMVTRCCANSRVLFRLVSKGAGPSVPSEEQAATKSETAREPRAGTERFIVSLGPLSPGALVPLPPRRRFLRSGKFHENDAVRLE